MNKFKAGDRIFETTGSGERRFYDIISVEGFKYEMSGTGDGTFWIKSEFIDNHCKLFVPPEPPKPDPNPAFRTPRREIDL